MAYAASDRAASPGRTPVTIKILIAGGFGVGKTTLVGSLTEIRPLRTEEPLSEPGAAVDRLDGVERKRTTTVALDFGRITIRENLVIYLFGAPGQDRFWFMWDELARGALGAIVMADTRRLADCFPSVDYFEQRGMPFIVAVNCFDGARRYRGQGATQRYLAMYHFAAPDIRDGAAWKKAANTPWTEKMRPHFRDYLRLDCRPYKRAR